MSQDIAIAIIINLGLILIFSWAFFWVMLTMKNKEAEKINKAVKKASDDGDKKPSSTASNKEPSKENNTKSPPEEDEFLTKLRQQKQQQLKRVNDVNSRLQSQNSSDKDMVQLAEDISELELQLHQSLNDINQQAAEFGSAGGSKDQFTADEDTPASRADLLKLKNKLSNARSEAHGLKGEVEKLSKQNNQLQRYRTEHQEMSNKVADYIEQNRKSVKIISALKHKLDAAQLAADEARAALEAANGDADDDALQAALLKAEQERQALEDQYNELLGQLEGAEKISEELERSQKECAQLEEAYLALVAELEQESQIEFAVEGEDAEFGNDDFGKPSKTNSATAASAAMNISTEALDEIADYNENWLADATKKAG
ncbi:hypothetical protein [Halioxenophilus aromaticivorans]|uniref:Chromosome segregation ATPase n=1 Tax=Halioxenophilus aromaticivorans TaxID=1306992 RepID=A0AAV3U5R1_9ALTE